MDEGVKSCPEVFQALGRDEVVLVPIDEEDVMLEDPGGFLQMVDQRTRPSEAGRLDRDRQQCPVGGGEPRVPTAPW